jgi:hypothetical protein
MTLGADGGIRAGKAARNQAFWREINERIRLVAQDSGNVEFLCECADLECTETIHLSVAEYEHIRSSPRRFPIAVGHDFPEVENVVAASSAYAIVEKTGKAGKEAAKMDPRSHP